MCGNSAAAVSTQRQHSYGLCLEGEVAKMVSQYGLKHIHSISVGAVDKLQSFQNWKPSAPEPWLALMKQTPLLWEQFGDRSILLFWALTSRSEETMTVLWWGVNSSTWCCFPLSPGINTSRNPLARRKSSHTPYPLPFPQSTPPRHLPPPLLWSLTSATHGHSPLTYQNG